MCVRGAQERCVVVGIGLRMANIAFGSGHDMRDRGNDRPGFTLRRNPVMAT